MHGDVIAKLVPGGANGLAHLSDQELLANTRRLVGRTNQLLAALLAHLAEVEARGIHRTRRCASLYTYCIYELRFSEGAAARRSAAARLVKEFPLLFDAVAEGELHLTGLLMIGPHLTPENHVEVLGRAKFRTKKELSRLVRELHPLPQVPDRIEPLGPAPLRALRNPTWEEYVTSLAPRVRELPEGERPRDWTSGSDIAGNVEADRDRDRDLGENGTAFPGARGSGSDAPDRWARTEPLPVGPVPQDLPPVTGPLHYQVQFSTVEEHAQLVERAKALLARERSGVTLGELQLEAMRLLVASLEKRKFAVSDRPRGSVSAPRRRGETKPRQAEMLKASRERSEATPREVVGATHPAESEPEEPARHGAAEPSRANPVKSSDTNTAKPNRASATSTLKASLRMAIPARRRASAANRLKPSQAAPRRPRWRSAALSTPPNHNRASAATATETPSAAATFLRPNGVKCTGATKGVVRMSTRARSGAARLATSSFITCSRLRGGAAMSRQT